MRARLQVWWGGGGSWIVCESKQYIRKIADESFYKEPLTKFETAEINSVDIPRSWTMIIKITAIDESKVFIIALVTSSTWGLACVELICARYIRLQNEIIEIKYKINIWIPQHELRIYGQVNKLKSCNRNRLLDSSNGTI